MVSVRLVSGILFGVILSVFSIGAFTQWSSFIEIQTYFGSDFMKVLYVLFRDNFAFEGKDILSLITANLRTLVGLPQETGDGGTVLRYFRAPGHEYWWQHPDVYSEITSFLESNFSIKP